MLGEEYTLKYTEQFRDDMAEAIGYIVNELRNPIAAQKLKDDVERDIIDRSFAPLAVAPYFTDEDTGDVYYPVYTGNFISFYVVSDHTIEFRRFLYARRNLPKYLVTEDNDD